MIIKAELTEKHIRDGKPRSAMSCPVALALREQGVSLAFVAKDNTICLIDDQTVYLSNNRELRQAIFDLDSGKEMKPGELKLDCREERQTKRAGGILSLKYGKRQRGSLPAAKPGRLV